MSNQVLPNFETICFDFWLEPQYWNTPPSIDIFIDNEKIDSVIVDQTMHYSFTHRLSFGYHNLKIHRQGKTHNESRVNNQGGYDTQSLTITAIKIDNINVRNILWDQAEFVPDYPEPWATEQLALGQILEKKIKGEMILGHNGIWVFEFYSPFYQYIVDWVRNPR